MTADMDKYNLFNKNTLRDLFGEDILYQRIKSATERYIEEYEDGDIICTGVDRELPVYAVLEGTLALYEIVDENETLIGMLQYGDTFGAYSEGHISALSLGNSKIVSIYRDYIDMLESKGECIAYVDYNELGGGAPGWGTVSGVGVLKFLDKYWEDGGDYGWGGPYDTFDAINFIDFHVAYRCDDGFVTGVDVTMTEEELEVIKNRINNGLESLSCTLKINDVNWVVTERGDLVEFNTIKNNGKVLFTHTKKYNKNEELMIDAIYLYNERFWFFDHELKKIIKRTTDKCPSIEEFLHDINIGIADSTLKINTEVPIEIILKYIKNNCSDGHEVIINSDRWINESGQLLKGIN